MQPDDRIRLQHMLDAAREATAFAQPRSRADIERDRMLLLAPIKSIEIVGEAATKVTEETQIAYPDIPWRDVVGMRNRLVHGYFDINLDIVWRTVLTDLPPLTEALAAALDAETP